MGVLPAGHRHGRSRVRCETEIAEFAAHGYHAVGTADIANRRSSSQPYIYALFSDKKALFLACHELAMQRLRSRLFEAAESTNSTSSAFAKIERAFVELAPQLRKCSNELRAGCSWRSRLLSSCPTTTDFYPSPGGG